MRVRIVSNEEDRRFPYRIQLLDLDEQLRRTGLPSVRTVESGRRDLPELKVLLGNEVVEDDEIIIPDGVVRIECHPYPKKHPTLNAKLVFDGLRSALSFWNVKQAARSSAGRDSELALLVSLDETSAQRKLFGRYIIVDPEICHGKPTFLGTRIMVAQVLKQVAKGMSWDAIIAEWRGSVTKEAIAEAIELAQRTFEDHAAEYVQESQPA